MKLMLWKRKHNMDEEVKQQQLIESISLIGNEEIDKLINEKYKLNKQVEEEEANKELLKEIYLNLIDILKRYCDLSENNYSLIALWIIGTYLHNDFPSYPFLFFNAMKGSGKTRLLKLVTYLSKDGQLLNSLSEAVLFRTTGTLGIDEFEGLNRKGAEGLRELLNSAYKKGAKVKRMRKVKAFDGEKQEVEEFDVYRPILMANIWGMESVLGDRCIHLVLEKSQNSRITKTMELYEHDNYIKKTLDSLSKCSLCSVVSINKTYKEWNEYIYTNYTTTYTTHNNTNYTHQVFFDEINKSDINGRHLELAMPLLIIANAIDKPVFADTLSTLKEIMEDKIHTDFTDNWDVSLIDFVSQETKEHYRRVKEVTDEFRQFVQGGEDISDKWMGRALKRLNLIKQKRRLGRGMEVILNIEKAQQKIGMFRTKDDNKQN